MITLKRAYDPVLHNDGARFLVERLWPRGVSKAKLRVDAWLKEVGPTTELRKWFGHDPNKWDEFRRRYIRELRWPGGLSCQPLGGAESRSSIAHTTRYTTMRLPCRSTCEGRRAGRRGPSRGTRRRGRGIRSDSNHRSRPSDRAWAEAS